MKNQLKRVQDGRQNGFSLLELMIALVIFLVTISAIYGVARIASIQRTNVSQKTDALKGARIALSYIRRDALNAGLSYHRIGGLSRDNFANGLIGLPMDTDSDWDLLTGILGGNNVNPNVLNGSNGTDTIAFAYRDLTFNDGNPLNYTSATTSSSTVNINTATNGAANARKYDLYLFETGTTNQTQIIGMATDVTGGNLIQLAVGDPLGINQAANGSGSNKSLLATNNGAGTIKRVNWVSYSVTNNGVLVRKTFGNKNGQPAAEQIETRELIYGVKDMQIKYLLDDKTVSDDPSLNNNSRINQAKMNQIVQIEVIITILPPKESSQSPDAPITIKETISTRNLRYDIG